jgi:hypothetical protein
MALRLLAHELRAPLGILQGYLRLLREGRVDKDAEMNMLTVMLKETGRISLLARQASDLAAWQAGNAALEPADLPASVLVERVVAAAAPLEARAPEESGGWVIRSVHSAALVDGLVAIAELVRRENPDRPLVLALASDGRDAMTITVGPVEAPGGDSSQTAPRVRTLSLDAGGHGLALVVADAVLSAHGARVTTTAETVSITLPLKGSA